MKEERYTESGECVSVCVCVRKRERHTHTQTNRQTDRQTQDMKTGERGKKRHKLEKISQCKGNRICLAVSFTPRIVCDRVLVRVCQSLLRRLTWRQGGTESKRAQF